ncbi:hypothetical protein PF002_g6774 [Phytophthora fragariae]|uniref:Uncharacterized protein n=1 Tax=Phytophthora fragariae TaxID=53985 RepID=A0A6A4A4F7_9STRA|nr:hypothetical protein PF002_g6774 [Phytophthora fragariae]
MSGEASYLCSELRRVGVEVVETDGVRHGTATREGLTGAVLGGEVRGIVAVTSVLRYRGCGVQPVHHAFDGFEVPVDQSMFEELLVAPAPW